MNASEDHKLKSLIAKYNPILKESIQYVLAEDLFNLIIVNGDDKDFELKNMLADKEKLKEIVMREFIRLNNQQVTSELRNMDEIKFNLIKTKQGKLRL